MLVIAGRMSARYKGRIDAELSLGDALLLIREPPDGDGSVVLLDAAAGLQPRNWMPAGSIHEITPGGYKFSYPQRDEVLEVFIEKIHNQMRFPAEVGTTLYKIGAETEKADLLATCLEKVAPNLKFIAREFTTLSGPIDIMAIDTVTNEPVVIEVKRRKANGANDLYQLKRYMFRVRKDKLVSRKLPRGYIVAPSFTKGLLEDVKEEEKISLVRLHFKDIKEYLDNR